MNKNKNPLVSIIIPCKDSSKYLEICLNSIRYQTYRNTEVIIVDNNSNDNTVSIARKYTKLIFNKGPERSAQRNFGYKKSKGQYLLFIDSDMELKSSVVQECVLKSNLDHAMSIIIPELSVGQGFWAKVKAYEKSYYLGNSLIESARFFDRKLFSDVGGYDEKLNSCEDWDIQNRVNEFNMTHRIQSAILHHEGNPKIFSSSKKKNYYSKWIKIYKKKYPELAKKQFSFLARFPLRIFLIKSLRHPILTTGMIIMKSLEMISIK